ncbi:MAG: mannitol dehydrogenase family protein [Spirochaetaceae bacterium]|jgi:fructuronate reductase|nr:mannitol dehydrogenase family protein [Spirochaetaceae bacterium]
MKLNDQGLKNKGEWEKAGFTLPKFDRAAMIAATEKAPGWVHFGAGNIFRAFPAALQQRLLEGGLEKTGIIVAEGYDGEIIDKAYTPYDCLSLLVTLKADGNIEKTVIASVAKALRLDMAPDMLYLKRVFTSPSLRMVSFTITEKGYSLVDRDGKTDPGVAKDFAAGPEKAESYMGRVAALCYGRYKAGSLPFAMVSMDNCSHNGDKLFAAVDAFAQAWVKGGLADRGFLDYVRNPKRVSFPWSMIDKITPRPDDSVRASLNKAGFSDTEGTVTAKSTYVAPFVNAEETQYLVIEDLFPAGRPALEKTGVLFTDRATVDQVEKMKVCTCLNPLHTALAVFGCLLGFTKICDEMQDEDLVKLVRVIGYTEGLPVVVNPGIISPQEFIDTVVNVRFPNPFMPDTPQRIACDCSQKIPIRFGETIKAYAAKKSAANLTFIPLVLAAWLRYLLGVDDEGRTFSVSPDPLYESLARKLTGIQLGGPVPEGALHPILSDQTLFASDLYAVGLGDKVEAYFKELIAGPGAVRRTLRKTLG